MRIDDFILTLLPATAPALVEELERAGYIAKGLEQIEFAPNCIVWEGVHPLFADALNRLLMSETIEFQPLAGHLNSAYLPYPVAESVREYETPRWLPGVFAIRQAAA